jgi:hypothetical protein
MDRPLKLIPDTLGDCRDYARDLMREIWALDRRWTELKARILDADRMGHQLDILDQMRHLEKDE